MKKPDLSTIALAVSIIVFCFIVFVEIFIWSGR